MKYGFGGGKGRLENHRKMKGAKNAYPAPMSPGYSRMKDKTTGPECGKNLKRGSFSKGKSY